MCGHRCWDHSAAGLAGRRSRPRGYSPQGGRHRTGSGYLSALKAAGQVAAAVEAHLIEQHKADPERAAAQGTFTSSVTLLRRARERLGQGLRAVGAGDIAGPEEIWVRTDDQQAHVVTRPSAALAACRRSFAQIRRKPVLSGLINEYTRAA